MIDKKMNEICNNVNGAHLSKINENEYIVEFSGGLFKALNNLTIVENAVKQSSLNDYYNIKIIEGEGLDVTFKFEEKEIIKTLKEGDNMVYVMKPMKYAEKYEDCMYRKTQVLCDGVYKGYRFIVLDMQGNHPCAYVELPQGHPKYGVTDHDYWHVGPNEVTYGRDYLTDILSNTWVIGWDYGHWGDYSALDQCGRKWDTSEIVEECFEAIEDLIFMNNIEENDMEDDDMEDDIIKMCDNIIKTSQKDNKDDFMEQYMKLTEALKQEVIEDMKNEEEYEEAPSIEFVSWTQESFAWCSSDVTIKFNGEEITLQRPLISGGSVWFGDNWEEHVEDGPWSIDEDELPEELKPYIDELTEIINESIPYGCCGGCI